MRERKRERGDLDVKTDKKKCSGIERDTEGKKEMR